MTEEKILKQVEYYFSDANLSKDDFLWNTISEDSQGWMPISILLKFNRLRSISEDQEVIANAISQSKELLELNEDRSKVRRKTQIKPKAKDAVERSIYIKGLPTTLKKPVEAIEEYLSKYEIEPIHINAFRKFKTRAFLGEAFVELKSIEDVNKILENKQKFEETEITIMKKSEFPGLNNKKKLTRQLSYLPLLVAEDEVEVVKKVEPREHKKHEQREQRTAEDEKNADLKKIEEGSMLYFKLSTDTIRLENIKAFFNEKTSVAWILKEKDTDNGIILFNTKDAEKINEELKQGEQKIEEATIETRLATSEEEEKLKEAYLKFRENFRSKKGGRFNNNNKNRNFKRKADSYPDNAPEAKQEKTE